jgi:hypothetical protein
MRLMADNDAGGHVAILVRIISGGDWNTFWNDLELVTVTFEDLGIDRDVSDAVLWRACQREQVVLITNNRNADDPDSLESTISAENRPDSLPVFTLARAARIATDRAYAERTAISLLDYLTGLDDVRGTGRIFIP